jgi:hypothetical protein
MGPWVHGSMGPVHFYDRFKCNILVHEGLFPLGFCGDNYIECAVITSASWKAQAMELCFFCCMDNASVIGELQLGWISAG